MKVIVNQTFVNNVCLDKPSHEILIGTNFLFIQNRTLYRKIVTIQ
jgi:hypothetical protein